MDKKAPNYIGVTGFNQIDQVKEVYDYCESILLGYTFMYGFTSSNKRLNDTSSSGKTSPAINELPLLLKQIGSRGNHLPMIHYFTSNPQQLGDELLELFISNGIWQHCQALQLNAEWPDIRHLEKVKAELGDLQVVLQIPKSALRESNTKIVRRAQDYSELIQYLLIDPSGGLGIDFDIVQTTELMLALDSALPMVRLGVAGGLGPSNVAKRIQDLATVSPCGECRRPRLVDFCVDAQGKLRASGNLDTEKAKKYIEEALGAFCEI